MRAVVNEGCVGCGACAAVCPAVFHLEDGVSHGGEVPKNQENGAREAADCCPVAVITIED